MTPAKIKNTPSFLAVKVAIAILLLVLAVPVYLHAEANGNVSAVGVGLFVALIVNILLWRSRKNAVR